MDAARVEFGLRVPHDVSVVGFDDIKQAGWLSYGLTTFAQPVEKIAAHVGELIGGKAVTTDASQISFMPEVVWRGSVRT